MKYQFSTSYTVTKAPTQQPGVEYIMAPRPIAIKTFQAGDIIEGTVKINAKNAPGVASASAGIETIIDGNTYFIPTSYLKEYNVTADIKKVVSNATNEVVDGTKTAVAKLQTILPKDQRQKKFLAIGVIAGGVFGIYKKDGIGSLLVNALLFGLGALVIEHFTQDKTTADATVVAKAV